MQSVLTGGVSPMVLKDCASEAESQPRGEDGGGRGCPHVSGVGYDGYGATGGGAALANMAAGYS